MEKHIIIFTILILNISLCIGYINYLFIACDKDIIKNIADKSIQKMVYIYLGITIILASMLFFWIIHFLAGFGNYHELSRKLMKYKMFILLLSFLPAINYLFLSYDSSFIGKIDNNIIEKTIYVIIGLIGLIFAYFSISSNVFLLRKTIYDS